MICYLLNLIRYLVLGSKQRKLLVKMRTEKMRKEILEFNARNHITLWGPTGQHNDYANKNWAGLVGTYYLNRWEFFFDLLITSFDTGKPFDGRELNKRLLKYGVEWDHERTVYATQPSGDAFMLTKKLIKKYAYQHNFSGWNLVQFHNSIKSYFARTVVLYSSLSFVQCRFY